MTTDYSRDRSHFVCQPQEVHAPASVEDCQALVSACAAKGLSITPRGGGTSLGGQAIGAGAVLDLSRHLTRIDTLADDGTLWAQAGVTPLALDGVLRPAGRFFAPYPSTGAICTLGGMLGNNAWGVNAPRYGSTRDHVQAVEAVLADGSRVVFQDTDPRSADAHPLEAAVFGLLDEHREAILSAYPGQVPNNAGYALDRLVNSRPWREDGPAFNLTQLLAGSEGSLALTTAMRLRTRTPPTRREGALLLFDNVRAALRAVPGLMALRPQALELLDSHVLSATSSLPIYCAVLAGRSAEAVLLLELDEKSAAKDEVAAALPAGVRARWFTGDDVDQLWILRRQALVQVTAAPRADGRAPVSGLEDTAVPLAALPAYTDWMMQAVADAGRDLVVYGSVSMGVIYFRPFLNLQSTQDARIFTRLRQAQAEQVLALGGSVTAKHGDGRLRADLLQRQYPDGIHTLWRGLKSLFDPQGVFQAYPLL